jgi:hypothetical protein
MNMRAISNFLVAAMTITLCSCSQRQPRTLSSVDVSRLEEMAKRDQHFADFANRAVIFYQAVQNHDWATTYDMRTDDFKSLVSKAKYLETMDFEGKRWNLEGYRVLKVAMNAAGSSESAMLIVEYTERRFDTGIDYNCAVWKIEGGIWKCQEPGISSLSLMVNLGPPIWCKP